MGRTASTENEPSAEIVRVECAKCRRECDLSGVRATLCGDRACRAREMQTRVRFDLFPRNPLRRSCVSSARNAGESAICPVCAQARGRLMKLPRNPLRRSCVSSARSAGERPLRRSCASSARNAGESAIGSVHAQPSAEVVRVECAKCRKECDLTCSRATLCGDRARSAGESAI